MFDSKVGEDSVIKSCEFVFSQSEHVHFDNKSLEEAARVVSPLIVTKFEQDEISPNPAQVEETANWIFVCNLLNFSFWQHEKLFTVEFEGKQYQGYKALPACLKRALKHGIPVTDPEFLSRCDVHTLRAVFEGEGEMPMLKERIDLLKSAGKTLVERFDGKASVLLAQAGKSAIELVNLLIAHFPSFRDFALYKGQQVFILKRAQIMVADLWFSFGGKDLGEFFDIDKITMFADYRVPQALQFLGLMKYSPALLQILESRIEIQPGDQMEVEIRSCSIIIVELLKDAIRNISGKHEINAIHVDFALWNYAKENADLMSMYQIHLTRSLFY